MNDALVADRYRLDHRIGAGGMGYVWLAWDEVLRRNVAVKEVHLPAGLSDAEVDELHMRTLREARAAARLSHPNVVRTYDVLRTAGRPYIVMEYVQSRSLAEVIKADGPLLPERVARIGVALLGALKAAHEAGVLHRDIKPGNVLLGADGRVVLTDFGLAVFDDVGMHLTHPGVVHGSPQFIAPERAKDGTSTAASDLWSLGATLYAAVEGQSPYARGTSYATLAALATEPPDPPRNAGPLKPILSGLLRRDPASRISIEEANGRLQLVVTKGGTLPSSGFVPRQVAHEDSGDVSGPTPAEAAVAPVATPSGLPIRNRRAFSDKSAIRSRPPSPQPRDGGSADDASPAGPVRHEDTDQRMEKSWDLGFTDKRVRKARRLRRAMVSTVAAIAVVMVALAAGYLAGPHPKASNSSPPPPPAGEHPGLPGGIRWPCTPTVSAPVNHITGSQPANKTNSGLLDQWIWYSSPVGFQVAIPERFQVAQNADTSCLYDPNAARVLGVHRWSSQTKDPVAALKQQLTTLGSDNGLPGYKSIKIGKAPLQPNQAEAEYTYDGPNGRQHAVVREYISGSAAYALCWDTPELDWSTNYSYYNLIETSFAAL